MIDIIREIRQHLIDEKIVSEKQCKLNLIDQSPALVCIWLYGGYREAIGTAQTIQIKVLNTDNLCAEAMCKRIFASIISEKTNRITTINHKRMKIVETQQPFFVEQDTQHRFVWAFNITATAF